MKTKTKWTWGVIGTAALVTAILVFSFGETLLLQAGRFMAPEADHIEGVADVVILEGTAFISRGIVSKGVELLSSGKARRMIIVLHQIAPNHRSFAFHEDYASLVRKELHSLGLKDSAFAILVVRIANPITLTSARGALEILARDGVKSALLVSAGLHMRRSFLVYQHLSVPLNIKIYPIACFDEHRLDNWWGEESGIRDFVVEFSKLISYMAEGYIPLKFSY